MVKMTKKKIIILTPALSSGGAERVLSVLSTGLADAFSEVHYLMWYDIPVFYVIDDRVKIVSLESKYGSKKFITKMLNFRKYVNKEAPDLILAFGAPFSMISLISLAGTGSNVIAAERIDPSRFIWGKCLKILRDYLYKFAKGILTQTESGRFYFKGKTYYNNE